MHPYPRRPLSLLLLLQDEPLDAEGPRLAFEEMAKQVNALAAATAAQTGASPPAAKTADDVSVMGVFASLFFFFSWVEGVGSEEGFFCDRVR